MKIIAFALVFWYFFDDCLTLKGVIIKIPPAVVQGSKATLKCLFDLEGDKLYSVKWYRGAGEFYRYTPSESIPIKQFKIRGFDVSEDESNATQVVLRHVTREISGQFSCEVTADQPSFFTLMKTADLRVVELPRKDPYIIGVKSRYRLGEFLKANCTSERAYPGVNLTWYVNGRNVEGHQVHRYKKEVDQSYITSFSTLRLKIAEPLFENGKLKIRCSASLYHLYHRSSEKSVALEKNRNRSAYAFVATTTDIYPVEQWQRNGFNSPENTLIFDPSSSDTANSAIGDKVLNSIIFTVYFVLFYTR